MRRIIASLLSCALLLPAVTSGWAQDRQPRGPYPQSFAQSQAASPKGSRKEDLRRWWRSLSPEEQQRLRNLREQWQTLSPEQKQAMRKRLESFRRLSPQEQKRLRQNLRRWQQLTPKERKRLRKRHHRWQELPPEKRQALRERYRKFRNLPPEKRERMRERWKQFQQLPPEERQRLRREWKERHRKFQQLPPEERQRLRRERNTHSPSTAAVLAHSVTHGEDHPRPISSPCTAATGFSLPPFPPRSNQRGFFAAGRLGAILAIMRRQAIGKRMWWLESRAPQDLNR